MNAPAGRRTSARIRLLLAVALGAPLAAGAQTISPVAKIMAGDAAANDSFAFSVAVSDDVLVVGAPKNDEAADNAGAAYVFERSETLQLGWYEVQKLIASDAGQEDQFGRDVAISDDTIVVGAWRFWAPGNGAAYVFKREQGGWGPWIEISKLVPSQAGSEFGTAVAVDGDTIVVGDRLGDHPYDNCGTAYLFRRGPGDAWAEMRVLRPSDVETFSGIGASVEILGDTVIVGAPFIRAGTSDPPGAAHIFRRHTLDYIGEWGQSARITPQDGDSGDHFGHRVAIGPAQVLVGAYGDDSLGVDAGAAYVYDRADQGWQLTDKLTADDGVADDLFGISVAINGQIAVVGAQDADAPGVYNAGAAYVFAAGSAEPGGWDAIATLYSLDPGGTARFGNAVTTNGVDIVVGSRDDRGGGSRAGAAYAYHFSAFDMGDAPYPYPTLMSDNGARHSLVPGVRLGAYVDHDVDGQPTLGARGDDEDGLEDEDGLLSFGCLPPIADYVVRLSVSSEGFLNAWLDLNADGDWSDSDEHVFEDVALTQGIHSLGLNLPDRASFVSTCFRFRFSTQSGLSWDGPAPDGEVEDYWIDLSKIFVDDFESGDTTAWSATVP